MITRDANMRHRLAAVILCFVVLTGSQAAAGGLRPEAASSRSTAALGRTGFAYLGGLRRFAAAVLWNRLDPQSHEYYAGAPLAEQVHMMPTFRLVTMLDPQFEQAYYLASWMAWENLSHAEGIAIARQGLSANPESGMLAANLAQLLFIDDSVGNQPELETLIASLLHDELVWLDDEALFEGMAVTRDALVAYGREAEADDVMKYMEQLRDSGVGVGDHDHDKDGEQDH